MLKNAHFPLQQSVHNTASEHGCNRGYVCLEAGNLGGNFSEEFKMEKNSTLGSNHVTMQSFFLYHYFQVHLVIIKTIVCTLFFICCLQYYRFKGTLSN